MEKKLCPFGPFFREHRQDQGISLWDLAIRIPYRQGNIQRIERGLHEPRIGLAMRMVHGLDMDAGEFFAGLARQQGLSLGEENFSTPVPVLVPVLPLGAVLGPGLPALGMTKVKDEALQFEPQKDSRYPFGPCLRMARLRYGRSQKNVAEQSGYTLRNLVNVEKGIQEPGVMVALNLVAASQTHPKVFFHHLQHIMFES